MSINLDQTGPSHLLSTDEDGLILNGSQVISKSIHVAATPPQNLKLLWLDTTQAGYAAFPLGGGTDYILRTDGLGNVSWVPPSSLDVTRYRYTASTLTTTTGIDNGSTKSVIRFNNASMQDADTIYISNYDLAENDISEFLDSLNLFWNDIFLKLWSKDEAAADQVVGGVNAHQADDQQGLLAESPREGV